MAAMSISSGKLGAYTSKLRRVTPLLVHRSGGRLLFSTQPRQEQVTVVYIGSARTRANPLLEVNEQFPFAGDVSALLVYRDRVINNNSSSSTTSEGGEQRGTTVMASSIGELLRTVDENMTKTAGVKSTGLRMRERLGGQGEGDGVEWFEIAAVDCPRLLRKDLKELFPGQKMGDRVSVVNVSQRAERDMSVWDAAMEAERDQLIMKFVDAACAMCSWLKQQGYWADFIDPNSGRPFLGNFTNSTMFETDERYRELGFQIEDLGCCKVIKHAKWDTKAFIGTIFTDAPLNSEVIRQIVDESQ